MSCRLAPSILSFDHSCLGKPVLEMSNAGVERIHLDVMDGQFVPPISFGDGVAVALRSQTNLTFEAHLMTITPERQFDAFQKAGCRRIYFHLEATSHAHRLAQTLRGLGIEAGIAINPATPASAVEPLLNEVDAILVMTINPGWGGQKLIPSTLRKVKKIRDMNPDIDIEVDGGIDPETIGLAKAAGANLFVVGSFLTRSKTIAEGVAALEQACK